MKTFILILVASFSNLLANAQLVNYKRAQEEPNANYNTIVQQWRSYLQQKKSNFELQNPNKPMPHSLREEIGQFERWAYNWKSKVNANGSFPSNIEGWRNVAEADQISRTENTQSTTWTNIGPLNTAVTNGWTYGAGIGRINVIKRQPGTSVLLAGSAAGGIFRSTNWGVNWTPVSDNLAGLGVSDIIFDPNNSNIVYMATGDYDAQHISSLGLYKSTDGGLTWAATSLAYTLSQTQYISHIVIDPINSNILIATGKFKIFKSVDAGANWTDMFEAPSPLFFNDIVKIGAVWYASDKLGKLWRENPSAPDASTGFTEVLNSGSGRLDIATTPNDPTILYLLKETNPAFAKFNTLTNALVGPFSNVTNANSADNNANFNTQQGYNQVITVSPTNKDSIWVGEFSGGKLSIDGGGTWQNKFNGYYDPTSSSSNWGGFYMHSDQHCFEWVGSDTLLVGNDGGVYVGKVSTNSYAERFNGLVTTQSYSMAIFDAEPNNIMIGNQDNDGSSRIENAGTSTFYGAQAGDGTATAISRTDKNIRYVGSTQGGLSYRTDGYAASAFGSAITKPSDAPFVWDLQMHNTDGSILYGGYTGIYKMTGAPTGSWTLLNTGATKKVNSITLSNNNATSQKIIIIEEDNTVRKSADETTWTDITRPAGVNFGSIYAGKSNWDTLFATATGYNATDKIYMSTDNGANWTNITKNFPNIQAKKIIRWEGHDSIFVATEVGVYFASITDAATARGINGPNSWNVYGNTLPKVRVEDIEISNAKNELYIASFGRGVWVAPLSVANVLSVNAVTFNYTKLANNYLSINWTIPETNILSTTLQESADGIYFTNVATYTDSKKYNNNYAISAPFNTKYYRLLYKKSNNNTYNSNVLIVRANGNNPSIVYPNPAIEYVNINNLNGIKTLVLFNNLGMQVAYAAPKVNNYVLPMHLFPSGTYTISVTNNKGEITSNKIIKQ